MIGAFERRQGGFTGPDVRTCNSFPSEQNPRPQRAQIGLMMAWDVAQLVEHGTWTPPTQVRFPGAARDFSPKVNFPCRLSYGVRTPPCTIARITSVPTLKIPWSMSEFDGYGNTKTPSMRRRLGSATLSQLAFAGESYPNFHGRNPNGTIQLQKKKKKKKMPGEKRQRLKVYGAKSGNAS